MPAKITFEEFIKRAVYKYKLYFDYSLVEYKDYKTKVKIICPEHGVFEQTPYNHINSEGNGCYLCSGKITNTLENFILTANALHSNKYDYSLAVYKNSGTKLKIICPLHGIFEKTPNNHISLKQGCPVCSGQVKHNVDSIVNKLSIIHKNKYKYNLKTYTNNKQIIEIICPEHGVFKQKINAHMSRAWL